MDYEKYKIKDYKHWTVYLHTDQYYLGRVYVWAKRGDALDFIEMASEEREEFFEIGQAVNKVLKELLQPDLMNYAALANVARHLHVHLIPRYASPRSFDDVQFVDERWGQNYAPYNRDFRVQERVLLRIRDAIKEKL